MDKIYPLPNSHLNFTEPAMYFDKAIAISEIISVPENLIMKLIDHYI